MSSVLSHYQIAPGQLVPNSWLILLSIERLPEVFGTGIDLEEFRSLYFLRELPSHRGRVQIYCRDVDRALITDCTVNHRRIVSFMVMRCLLPERPDFLRAGTN